MPLRRRLPVPATSASDVNVVLVYWCIGCSHNLGQRVSTCPVCNKQATKRPARVCIACEGSGRNTKLRACYPCEGKGYKMV